jgi:hypothetical protein
MTDAALFHTLLSTSARHFNLISTGTALSLEHEFYEMRAMQLVSARLQNLTDRISDTMILTVAYFAIANVSFSSHINANGLSKFLSSIRA